MPPKKKKGGAVSRKKGSKDAAQATLDKDSLIRICRNFLKAYTQRCQTVRSAPSPRVTRDAKTLLEEDKALEKVKALLELLTLNHMNYYSFSSSSSLVLVCLQLHQQIKKTRHLLASSWPNQQLPIPWPYQLVSPCQLTRGLLPRRRAGLLEDVILYSYRRWWRLGAMPTISSCVRYTYGTWSFQTKRLCL